MWQTCPMCKGLGKYKGDTNTLSNGSFEYPACFYCRGAGRIWIALVVSAADNVVVPLRDFDADG